MITVRKSAYMGGQDRLYAKANALVEEGESCVRRVEGQPRPEGGWPRVAASDDVKAIVAFAEADPETFVTLLDRFQARWWPTLRDTFAGMANPETFGLEDLPQDRREQYTSKDGGSFLVTAYPRGNVWDESFQARLLPELAEVSDRITGTPVLFLATIERGAAEGKRATVYALIAITLLLLIDFGAFRREELVPAAISTVLTLVPLGLGAIWMLGLMTLFGIELNMVNIAAVPLILGIGIDDGVHVMHRYRIEGAGHIDVIMRTVGRAILLTSITTIAAFGSFATGLYQGMVTLGLILSIGIAVCFVLSALFLPALLRIVELAGVEL